MFYVDLHLHLLPEVDDGPREMAESLEHAARMVQQGVREAVVTPHVGHPDFALDIATVPARTRALQTELDRAGIPLRLRPGGEIHPSAAPGLTERELAVIAQGPPGARWVLLEAPFAGIDDGFLSGCRAIRARGFGLVIAHPERADGFLADGLRRLQSELGAGALLQVNVCSLLGHHGALAQAGAERLVREDRAHVLASDGHAGTREHTLRPGFDLALAAGAPPLRAWHLTQVNPRLLLDRGAAADPTARTARAPARDGGRGRAVTAAREAAQRLGRRAAG